MLNATKRRRQNFAKGLWATDIQFHLYTNKDVEKFNWEMPQEMHTTQPEGARQMMNKTNGGPMQKSMFSPVYENDMNGDERSVAMYLDDQNTIKWWHRNVSRNHYSLQGWRRDRIYPDFICSVQTDKAGKTKLVVLEMKGEHLAGNEDTEYKKALLQLMTQSFTRRSSAKRRRNGTGTPRRPQHPLRTRAIQRPKLKTPPNPHITDPTKST